LNGCVATGSVATEFVALSGVATGCVAGSLVTDGSVAANSVAGAGIATGGAAVDGVAWGCSEGARRPESCVATGVPARGSASEGSDGAVVMVVAKRTVALVGAPAECPPTASGMTPTSTRVERLAGVGDAASAGSVDVVTGPSCWPGVAEALSGGPLVGPNNPPGVVALRSAREFRLESTAVLVPFTRLRGPVSDAELVPTGTREAEAPFDSAVEAIVQASAAFTYTREANALTVAIRPKN